jgi:peptide/nickel transport system permease protein
MHIYLLKRLIIALAVALLSATFLASLVHLIPGDPVQLILGPRASEALSARVRTEMGLDLPIAQQIVQFIVNALRGDLGVDLISHVPITVLVGAVLPHTVILAVSGLGVAALIGIPLGVYAAAHHNTRVDRLIAITSVSFVSLPTYVIGLALLLVFAVQLGWLPALGAGESSDPFDYLRHLILPILALAIPWVGYLARLVRACMVEINHSDYVRTALAFGLPQRLVHYKYALRNAIIPTVAILGIGLGNLLGGAVFIEVIFTRPGLGRLIYDAIATRNYPIVRGGVLVAALLFVLANAIADACQHYLDPRLRNLDQEGRR